jgi:serine palmitoyltransferase
LLYKNFESFFIRYYYRRVRDTYNRPICSLPGPKIDLVNRCSDDHNRTYYYPGGHKTCLNMGSYNYLGFAENTGARTNNVIESIKDRGVATCSTRAEFGTLNCHQKLEVTKS